MADTIDDADLEVREALEQARVEVVDAAQSLQEVAESLRRVIDDLRRDDEASP